MTRLLGILLSVIGLAPVAKADVDACDDFLSRHYKRDLQPQSLSYEDRDYAGDVAFRNQVARIRVRNVGQVAMDGAPTARDPIVVSVNGERRTARLPMGLVPGADAVLEIVLPADTLSHCQAANVRIDLTRDVGQWGCLVFANDFRELTALRGGNRRCPH